MSDDESGVRTKTRFWSGTLPRIHRNAIPTSKLDRTPLSASGCCSTALHDTRAGQTSSPPRRPTPRLAFVPVTRTPLAPPPLRLLRHPTPHGPRKVFLSFFSRLGSCRIPSVFFFFFSFSSWLVVCWLGLAWLRSHTHTYPLGGIFFFSLGLGLGLGAGWWWGMWGSVSRGGGLV